MKKKFKNLKLFLAVLGILFSLPAMAENYGKTLEVTTHGQVIQLEDLVLNPLHAPTVLSRIKVKNGVEFSIQLPENHQAELDASSVGIAGIEGNQIHVVKAGSLGFRVTKDNIRFDVLTHVNYFGVLQFNGSDAPGEIQVTSSNQHDLLTIPHGKFPGIVWFNSSNEELANVPHGTETVSLSDLLLSNNTSFKVMLRDGTSNELPSGIGGGESWCEFSLVNMLTPTTYSVSLTAQPSEGGTVSGAGTYDENSSVTVSASASQGWRFVKWTENGSEVSTSTSYSFQITGNRNLVAVFKEVPPTTYSVTLSASPSDGGTVSGDGTFEENTVVTVVAVANPGWHFLHWQHNGTTVSSDSSYSFAVTDNTALVAVFGVGSSLDELPPATTRAVIADGRLSIYSNSAAAISMYDMHGRVLLRSRIEAGATTIPLDIPRGTYFVKVNEETYKLLY